MAAFRGARSGQSNQSAGPRGAGAGKRSRRGRRPGASGPTVDVEVYLAGISPDDILCCDGSGDLVPVVSVERREGGAHRLRVRCTAAGEHRLFPSHADLVHPQELGLSVSFRV